MYLAGRILDPDGITNLEPLPGSVIFIENIFILPSLNPYRMTNLEPLPGSVRFNENVFIITFFPKKYRAKFEVV